MSFIDSGIKAGHIQVYIGTISHVSCTTVVLSPFQYTNYLGVVVNIELLYVQPAILEW